MENLRSSNWEGRDEYMAAYSALVSLKHDLEMHFRKEFEKVYKCGLMSKQHADDLLQIYFQSRIREPRVRMKKKKAEDDPQCGNEECKKSLMESLMNTLEESQIRDAVVSVKKYLDNGPVFRSMKFRELYASVSLMNSLLACSLGKSYLQSHVRDVIVSIKQEVELRFSKDEFQILHRNITYMNWLLECSLGESYPKSRRKDVIVSMMKELDEKGPDPLFLRADFQKLYEIISLMMESLPKDSQKFQHTQKLKKNLERDFKVLFGEEEFLNLNDSISLMVSLLDFSIGESYIHKVWTKFQNRIKDVVYKTEKHVFFEGHAKAIVRFDPLGSLSEELLTSIDSLLGSGPEGLFTSTDSLFNSTILSQIIQEIVSINQELETMRDNSQEIETQTMVPQNLENLVSSTGSGDFSIDHLNPPQRFSKKKGKMVGFEKDLNAMLHSLTGHTSNFKVLTVTGMAGIGKTTFANELYDHPLVIHHFYVRARVTVTQEYQLRELLLGLLRCLPKLSDGTISKSGTEQLREELYRRLKGMRYLIMLDDVWDKQVWDELSRVFPKEKNGSRVFLTSQLQDVAIHASPCTPPHCLQFLGPVESWELLCSNIFMNEQCPEECASIGNQIAYKCHGLPLAIVIVGGLLSRMDKTAKDWGEVSENLGELVMDNGHQDCQRILALSYIHLPDPLKDCFLYMGIFPEDHEISFKRLIYLWIAEGFVQPKKKLTLEEVAEKYLEDLIARNLIMVKSKKSNGGIKVCHIHDLLRNFCIRESQKKNFFHVIPNYRGDAEESYKEFLEKNMFRLQRIMFHSNISQYMKIGASFLFTHSFFCCESFRPIDLQGDLSLIFKLLKVLDITHINVRSLPGGVLLLSKLSYLALTIQEPVIVSKLSVLHNLQACIIDGTFNGQLPVEFMEMAELRHFQLKRASCCHNVSRDQEPRLDSSLSTLPNLQSLSMVGPSSCTREIFLCMPNLKKLGVYENEEDYQFIGWFNNLACLEQLLTFKYVFSNPFTNSEVRPSRCPSWVAFPPNLMKLTLSSTSFPWEDMQQLSLLPKLEVLKLKNFAFCGAIWNLGESCFNSLKFLMIGSTNLQVWEADGSHFPSLKHLVLRHCRSLKEIPSGLGEATLLERIELHCCTESAATSARQLEEEQVKKFQHLCQKQDLSATDEPSINVLEKATRLDCLWMAKLLSESFS